MDEDDDEQEDDGAKGTPASRSRVGKKCVSKMFPPKQQASSSKGTAVEGDSRALELLGPMTALQVAMEARRGKPKIRLA